MSSLPPILFIPGLSCDERMYGHQIQALGRRGDVTACRLPVEEDIGAMARKILSVAPKQFVAVGASMAGFICLEIFAQAPDRVLGMGLIASNPDPDPTAMAARRKNMSILATGGRYELMWRQNLPRFVAQSRRRDKKLLDDIMVQLIETGADAFVAHSTAMGKRSGYRALLPGISVPTAVVAGSDDDIFPAADQLAWATKIPSSTFHIIHDCGHVPSMERPSAVTEILLGLRERAAEPEPGSLFVAAA